MTNASSCRIALVVILIGLTSCNSSPNNATSPQAAVTSSNILVSWTANREKAVNQSGGGYAVYYSPTAGFDIGTAKAVNVPYVSGVTTPVTTSIGNLSAGKYYIKVIAYSLLNPPGASSGARSKPSTELSISVP